MPSRFTSWLRRHQKSVGFFVTIIYGLLVLAAGLIGSFAGSTAQDKALNLLIGLAITFAIGQLFIFAIAVLWLTDYHLTDRSARRTEVEIFQSPVEFAQKKCAVLRDLDPISLKNRIYGVSHCNLFANPEGNNEQERAEVLRHNEEFFNRLAQLVMRSTNDEVRLRVLLQYDEHDMAPKKDKESNLIRELKARQKFFTDAGHAMPHPIEWDRYNFEVKRRIGNSGKDYFVINEHVFKTIRQTPGTGRSIYIYMRGQEIARSYWTWLHDLYEYGKDAGLVEDAEIQQIFLDLRAKGGRAS
jgi:hypothetical protein